MSKKLSRKSNLKKDVNESSDNEIIKLEGRLQLKEQENRDLKRKLKLSYTDNSVLEVFRDELDDLVKPIRQLPKRPIIKTSAKNREHLVMHISDQHADQVILPESVGGLESYDMNVALCRAENYVDKTLEYVSNMRNYKFDELWILMYGDHVSGEIHGAEHESFYRNMIRNSIAVGQMNSLMIRDMASFFPKVNVVCVVGNHGRRSVKKDYTKPRSNWDYLVFEHAKMMCKDLKNVEFTIPNSFSVNVDINGCGFNVNHGDDVQSYNSLPWYGIERKTRRLVALNSSQGNHIDYFVFGHFHTSTMMANLNGETIINGAWLATDPYAYNKLSTYNTPKQWIHGVDKDGISWRYGVKLADKSYEKSGPKRYKIDLA